MQSHGIYSPTVNSTSLRTMKTTRRVREFRPSKVRHTASICVVIFTASRFRCCTQSLSKRISLMDAKWNKNPSTKVQIAELHSAHIPILYALALHYASIAV